MKKRFLISIFTILVAVSFIVGLAACGDSEKTDSVTQGSDPEINDPNQKYKEMDPSEGITFYEYDDHCVVTGIGTCTDEELIIPSEYDGLPVTAIDDGAFYYCKSFTTVYIPDSVTYIGDDAFYYCTYLKDVVMGDNVEYIGHRAFYFCKVLENITFPDSVTTIGNSAFESCVSLESINIPKSVTSLGERAFEDCAELENVYYNATTDIDSVLAIFENAGTDNDGLTFIMGTAVKEIPEHFFYSFPELKAVLFEEGSICESFGEYSFAYCNSLKTVELPESLISLAKYAFYNCRVLSEIYINAVAMDDLPSSNYTFYNAGIDGDGITATIGKSVTAIPDNLFCPRNNISSYAPNLTTVVFEENSQCKSIGTNTFDYCQYLTGVYITDVAAWCSIDFGNFYNYLTHYAEKLYLNNQLITELVIPDGVTSINKCAFYCCSYITSVYIPDSVTSIEKHAFENCSSLEYVETGTGIESISNNAFYECTSLKSITIPESVTSIGKNVFYNCTALEYVNYNPVSLNDLEPDNYVFYSCGSDASGITVTIGINVTRIPAYLFDPCDDVTYAPNITRVVFEEGNGCTDIGSYAFCECSSLSDIAIPETTTSIGECAFYGCSSLLSVTIPEGLTLFEDKTFYGCTSLVTINYNATAAELASNASDVFYKAGKDGTGITLTIGANVTEIPSKLFGSKSSSAYAAEIKTLIFVDNSKCTSIYMVFENCVSITDVYITDIVAWCATNFGTDNPLNFAQNFYLNNELVVDLVIPDEVTEISNNAFYGCKSIKSVTIGNGVTLIDRSAFYNCPSLTTLTLGNAVTTIETYAFCYCTSLTTVIVDSELTTIKMNAFYGCSSIATVYYMGSAGSWIMSTNTGNSTLTSATRYYYSELEPSYDDEYSYWHYVDGEIVVWKKED